MAYSRRLRLGRLEVDPVTFNEALDAVEALVAAGEGGGVYTPNVDHVVNVETNAAFREAYAHASLSVADGMPLVWASRLLSPHLPERVAGSDLIVPLLQRAGRRGWRVFFLGAGPGVAEKAAEAVRARFGTLVVDAWAPEVDVADERTIDEIVARVNATAPQLVLLALGSPKQELLADLILPRVRPAVVLGIGAGLGFLAGTVKRAPPFFRDHGLEWLYRLTREPGRLWRRYLVNDPKFALILARTMLLSLALWQRGVRPSP